MKLTIATDLRDVRDAGEILAGGTDLSERLRSGVTRRDVVDIAGLPGLDSIGDADDGSTTVGALVTIARIGSDDRITTRYPALAAPAQTVATPQIRAMGTLGGALCQRTRCWYYRHPHLSCFKTGGDACPAREGNDPYGVVFDLGPCVHPHPSSIALGVLAYDGTFDTTAHTGTPVADLYGDGRDPTRDHLLADGDVLLGVTLPPPTEGERTSYVRLMSRKWAEWPLVECVVRLLVADGAVTSARVCLGAVANIPLRTLDVEDALVGQPARADDGAVANAAALAIAGASPLDQTRYKLPMITAVVQEALERALRSGIPRWSGEGDLPG